MTRNTRLILTALLLLVVLTTGTAAAVLTLPWRAAVLPHAVGAWLKGHTPPEWVFAAKTPPPPSRTEAVVVAGGHADADVELVIALSEVTAAPIAEQPPQNEPVDYTRLNKEVRVVADTLERFNQKLLRMIAQARALQQQQQAAALAVDEIPAEVVEATEAVEAAEEPTQ